VPLATLIISSMDIQFNSLMSLGTRNYFARCPQRPRALLALRPSQLAAADNDRPHYVGRPGAARPRDRGRWPHQATGGCRLGHTVTRSPAALSCPSRGDTPLVSPWPHWLTSSTSVRATTAPRALPLRPFSYFNKSFHVRMTLREAGLRKR